MVKIFGVAKSEFHNYYELDKKQKFFSGFRKLLVDLGFAEDDSNDPTIYGFGRPRDNYGEAITTKEVDIQDLVDEHYFWQNNYYMVDVIFGKAKIFLIIATKKDRQQEISQKVKKFCSS